MSDQAMKHCSRRKIIRSIGVAGFSTGLLGEASADQTPELVRRIIGAESKAAAERVIRSAERVIRELDFGDIGYTVVGEFRQGQDVEIQSSEDVRYVETESEMKLLGESQQVPWGVEEIGAPGLHRSGTNGASAHIAILDSGIDSDHPDLKPNLGKGKSFVPCNDSCRRDWDDDHNHGTHVAGIADAISNDQGVVGVSTEAILHSGKVMSADGSGDSSTIAAGINWAADQGYDVANMSIGTTSSSEVMRDAVKYADTNDLLVVSVAGNEDADEDTVHYPGAYPEAICVGATNKDGSIYKNSMSGEAVELVAPGENIRSCVRGGYEVYSGTSMAAPHVSGAAALLFAEGYSKEEVRKRLRDTATDLGYDEDEQGHGLIDPNAALGDGIDEDEIKTFGVSTHSATGVEKQAAILNGEITSLGDYSSADIEFQYWAVDEKQSTKQTVTAGECSSARMFEATVDGLETDTTYKCTAAAAAENETHTGEVLEFTTVDSSDDGSESGQSVIVETDEVSDIDSDEAEMNGRVTRLVGVEEVTAYFQYWTRGDKDGTRVRFPVDVTDDPDDFDEDAENLRPDTTYVVVAECVTPDGTRFQGDAVEFTTSLQD